MASNRQSIEERLRREEEREAQGADPDPQDPQDNPFLEFVPKGPSGPPHPVEVRASQFTDENPFLNLIGEGGAPPPAAEEEDPGLLERAAGAVGGVIDRFRGDEPVDPEAVQAGPRAPARPERETQEPTGPDDRPGAPAGPPTQEQAIVPPDPDELRAQPDAMQDEAPGRTVIDRLRPTPRLDLRGAEEDPETGELRVTPEDLYRTEAVGGMPSRSTEEGELGFTSGAARVIPRGVGTTIELTGRSIQAIPGFLEGLRRATERGQRAEFLRSIPDEHREELGAQLPELSENFGPIEAALAGVTDPVGGAIAEQGAGIAEMFPHSRSVREGGAFQPTNPRWWLEAGGDAAFTFGLSMTAAGLARNRSQVTRLLAFASPTAVLEGGGAYDEVKEAALERGASPEDAEVLAGGSAVLTGIGASALELIPGSIFVLDKIPGAGTAWGRAIAEAVAGAGQKAGRAGQIFAGGSGEALEEVAQGVWGDVMARVIGQDPDAFEDALNRYLAGGTLGFAVGAPVRAAQVAGREQPAEPTFEERRAHVQGMLDRLDFIPAEERAAMEERLGIAPEEGPADPDRADVPRSSADAPSGPSEGPEAVTGDSQASDLEGPDVPLGDPELEQLAQFSHAATGIMGDRADRQEARARLERLDADTREIVLQRVQELRELERARQRQELEPTEEPAATEEAEVATEEAAVVPEEPVVEGEEGPAVTEEAQVEEEAALEPEPPRDPLVEEAAAEMVAEIQGRKPLPTKFGPRREAEAKHRAAFQEIHDKWRSRLTPEQFDEAVQRGRELQGIPRTDVPTELDAESERLAFQLAQGDMEAASSFQGIADPVLRSSIRERVREIHAIEEDALTQALEGVEPPPVAPPLDPSEARARLEAGEAAPTTAVVEAARTAEEINPFMELIPRTQRQERRQEGLVGGIRRRFSELIDPTVRQEIDAAQEEIEAARRVLAHAFLDPTTELPNPTAWGRARENVDTDPAQHVLSFDITEFKTINDNLGWDRGNERLKEVADIIQAAADELGIQRRDRFRAGGDEFAVVGSDPAVLEQLGELVQERVPDIEMGPFTSRVRYGVGESWGQAESRMQGKKALETGPKGRDKKIRPAEPEEGLEDVSPEELNGDPEADARSIPTDEELRELDANERPDPGSDFRAEMEAEMEGFGGPGGGINEDSGLNAADRHFTKERYVKRYMEEYGDLDSERYVPPEELQGRWLSLMRGRLHTQLDAELWTARDQRVARNTYGDAVPGTRSGGPGQKARGRDSQQRARIKAIERLLARNDLEIPDADPWFDVGKGDVFHLENKDLVGRAGSAIKSMPDHELLELAQRTIEQLPSDPYNTMLNERLAILYAEATGREGREVDMTAFWGEPDADGFDTVREDGREEYLSTLYYGQRPLDGNWWSRAARAVELAPQEKANGEQWLGMIRNAKGGVSQKEIAMLGLETWLEQRADEAITKEQILNVVAQGSSLSESSWGMPEKDTRVVSARAELRYQSEQMRQALARETELTPEQIEELVDDVGHGAIRSPADWLHSFGFPEPSRSQWQVYRQHWVAVNSSLGRLSNAKARLRAPFAELTVGEWGHDPDSNYRRIGVQLNRAPGQGSFTPPSSHQLPVNTVVDLRLTDRSISREGEAGTFSMIEETQSDWAQAISQDGVYDGERVNELRAELKAIISNLKAEAGISFTGLRATDLNGEEVSTVTMRQEEDGEWIIEEIWSVEEGELDIRVVNRGTDPEELWRDTWRADVARHRPMAPHEWEAYKEYFLEHHRIVEEIKEIEGGAPPMPFSGLNDWVGIAVRRTLMDAAMRGNDGIMWASGEQVADRYNLRKRTGKLVWSPTDILGEEGLLVIYDRTGQNSQRTVNVRPDELENWVGAELAERMRQSTQDAQVMTMEEAEAAGVEVSRVDKHYDYAVVVDGEVIPNGVYNDLTNANARAAMIRRRMSLEGDDLEIGGDFHLLLYNRVLPRVAAKEAKKLGLEIEQVRIRPSDPGRTEYVMWDLGHDLELRYVSETERWEVWDNQEQTFQSVGHRSMDVAIERAIESMQVMGGPDAAIPSRQELNIPESLEEMREAEAAAPATNLVVRFKDDTAERILYEGLPTVRERHQRAYGSTKEARAVALELRREALKPENRLKVVEGVGGTAWVDIRGQELLTPEDVFAALAPFRSKKVEKLHEILLDEDGRVVSHVATSSGAIDYVKATQRQIGQLAERIRRTGAAKVIFAHNHPSGDATPSPDDVAFTGYLRDSLRGRHRIPAEVEVDQWVIDTDRIFRIPGANLTPTMVFSRPDIDRLINDGVVEQHLLEGEKAYPPDEIHLTHPGDVAAWSRQMLDPSMTFSVVYTDTRARAVALEPKDLASIPGIGNWLPQRMKALGAAGVFLVTNEEALSGKDLFREVSQSGVLRHVTDIMGMHPIGPEGGNRAFGTYTSVRQGDIDRWGVEVRRERGQSGGDRDARRLFEDRPEYPGKRPDELEAEEELGAQEEEGPLDLFGEPVRGRVTKQGDVFGTDVPQGASDALNDAKATVSALKGKIARGEASTAELQRFNEARTLIRSSEGRGMDPDEVRARLPDDSTPADNRDLFDTDDDGSSPVESGDPQSPHPRQRTSPPRDPTLYRSNVHGQMPMALEAPKRPEPGKPVAVVHVIDAIADVTAAAGRRIPFRIGFLPRTAQGVFKVNPEVIRTRTANDIPTAAHEAAHAIEKILWGWPKGGPWTAKTTGVSRKMQSELVEMGKALYGDTKPQGGYKREGWAEFIRAWVTNDAQTLAMAPTLKGWFEDTFFGGQKGLELEGSESAFPAVGKALEEARALATRYQQQGSKARASANLIDPASPGRRLKKRAGQLRRLFSMEKLVEMAQPMHELAREAERSLGRELKPQEDPFFLMSALRTTHDARTKEMVERGMIDLAGNVVGPPLEQIRGVIERGERQDFMIYLWAKRAEALWTDPEGPRDPGLSIQDAMQVIEELENPRFQRAAQMVYDWNDGVLSYVAQASPTFKEIVERVRERDPGNYVPLQREFDQLDSIWNTSGGGAAGIKSPVKRLRGSGRRVKDPFQSMLSNTRSMLRSAHERAVVDAIVKLSEKAEGLGHIIERVPRTQVPVAARSVLELMDEINRKAFQAGGLFKLDPNEGVDEKQVWASLADEVLTFFAPAQRTPGGEPIVPIVRQGKIEWYYLDQGLFDALSSLDVYRLPSVANLPLLEATLGTTAAAFRAGTTGLRASFGLLWNPLRDPQTMLVNSRSSAHTPRIMKEWFQMMVSTAFQRTTGIRSNEYLDAYLRLGGEMAEVLGQDIGQTRRASRRLFAGRVARTLDPRQWYDWYRNFIQFPESAPRVAELKLVAKEIGWEPGQPMTLDQSLELLLAAKQVTTDFTAAGELGRVMNRMVPFHNAAIQGPRANLRAAKRSPARFIMRGLQLSLLSIGLWFVNRDEEWWDELTAREKFTHWWFKVDVGDREELVRIPRAFEIGLTFGAIPEMLLDAWYFQDPSVAGKWAHTLLETSFPPLVPTVLEEGAEQLANRDFYWETPIVPMGQERLPAPEQFNEYTSIVARELGEMFNASPRRIDHAIDGIFGPVAGDIIEAVGLGGTGRTPLVTGLREGEPSDLIIFGRLFMRAGTAGPDRSVNELYDRLEEAQKLQASSVVLETPQMEQARLRLNDAAQVVSALAMIQRHTEDTDQRRALKRLARDVAQDALEGGSGRGRFQALRQRWEAQEERVMRRVQAEGR